MDMNRLHIEQVSLPTTPMQLRPEPKFHILTGVQFPAGSHCVLNNGREFRIEATPFDLKSNAQHGFVIQLSAGAFDVVSSDPKENGHWRKRIQALVADRLEEFREISVERARALAQQRWNEVADGLPRDNATEGWDRLVRECASVLLSNSIAAQPAQGYGSCLGGRHGTFPARGFYEAFWIWDCAKQAWGLAHVDVALAKDNILLMLDHQDPGTGSLYMVHPDSRIPSAQPPLLTNASVAVFRVLQEQKRRDEARQFLREVYEPLCRWHHWWFRERDRNGDGLCEWGDNLESGLDDSPRWDTERPAGFKNDFGSTKYTAVDLNAYLIADKRALAQIAQELGLGSDALQWEQGAEDLAQRVLAVLYDRSDNLFYDAHIRTGEFKRLKTLACFLPLWAGVPLPSHLIKDMIERYLLSKHYFAGEIPFPSVAYSERTYSPSGGAGGYWRGPTWIDQAFLMLCILEKNRGLLCENAASRIDGLRRRLLEMVSEVGIHENYRSRVYSPHRIDRVGVHSRRDFSWTAACTIVIAAKKFWCGSSTSEPHLPMYLPIYLGIEMRDTTVYGSHKEFTVFVTNRLDATVDFLLQFDTPDGWKAEALDPSTSAIMPAKRYCLATGQTEGQLFRLTIPGTVKPAKEFNLFVRAVAYNETVGEQRFRLHRYDGNIPSWISEISAASAGYLLWNLPPFIYTFDDERIGQSETGLLGRHHDGLLNSRLRFREHQALAQHRGRQDVARHVLSHIAAVPDLEPLGCALAEILSTAAPDADRERNALTLLELVCSELGERYGRLLRADAEP